ncbi:MAG: NADH-dependent [FeFe] hydrogenase, group A6 [Candidatus Margulisiibacteriota bacterium]|jgi:iron-only hydrogenase group A
MTKIINLTIDKTPVQVPEGTTILEAAKQVGVKIPSLCYHPELSKEGQCRICIVEVKGMRDLVASCAYPVTEGMEVTTNNPEIRQHRRDIVELILDNHPDECHTCERDSNCELQRLAYATGVRNKHFKGEKKHYENDFSSHAVIREPDKCILCGRCVRMCSEIQGVNCLEVAHRGFKSVVVPAYEAGFKDSVCTSCGQCINVCPTAAFLEQDATNDVWQALNNPDAIKVVQVAPAIRAAIGEGFGLPVGTNVEKKLVTALKMLGFNYVFDSQFTADLTILEEASELINRIQNNKPLPVITSCSPGWINFIEKFYPEFLPNLSTCMSPMGMLGSLIKRYFPKVIGKEPQQIYSTAIMPCTAKKDEAKRDQLKTEDGLKYIDAVLTTRELVWMLKSVGIDLNSLEETEFDSPLGASTGAATIFGATGGVMEAALRTAYYFLTKEELPGIEYKPVRGAVNSIKEADLEIAGIKLKIAVASGLGNARILLDRMKLGEKFDFIEIMACPGGCINGGGQPYMGTMPFDRELLKKRSGALYQLDEENKLRRSHENQDVNKLYNEVFEKYGSAIAHKWLHTHYQEQNPKSVCVCDKTLMATDPRYKELDAIIDEFKHQPESDSYLIPALHKAQELFGFLSNDTMNFISDKLGVPQSQVYGVATFYHLFSLKPKGKTRFSICLGTACYVKGANVLVTEIEKNLGIKLGETSEDLKYSFESMRCFGACGLAPVMLVNDKVYGKVTVDELKKILKEHI